MNRNAREFEQKFTGKRRLILRFLSKELKRLKKLGMSDHTDGTAQAFTKHIVNIMMEEN